MTSWPSGNFHWWRHKGFEKGGKGIPTETSQFGLSRFSLVGFERVTSFYSHQCSCACTVRKWEFTDIPEQATSCQTSHFLFVADNKSNIHFCESPELQNLFLRDNYAFKEGKVGKSTRKRKQHMQGLADKRTKAKESSSTIGTKCQAFCYTWCTGTF